MPQFKFLLLSSCLLSSLLGAHQPELPTSGGPLPPLQSQFDVHSYELNLTVNPEQETISGFVTMGFTVQNGSLDTLLLNLINRYTVSKVTMGGASLPFHHENHFVKIILPSSLESDQTSNVTIYYSGSPPIAEKPPWSGGFTWKRDSAEKPWIGISCQEEGAKIWWPCKDHPSDEPDSVRLHITVPEDLVCASNGVLDSVTTASPGWKTWHWTTHYPINGYGVTLNIGDYVTYSREVTGIAPDPVPLVYYVLKEDTAGAEKLMDQAETMLKFYSRHFGDYPFYKEKFGLAESPFWGMEHQTLNAYGNHYKNTALGYDFLMLHEMGHEWFGNSMTVHDWADFWLHEGTDIYAEAMFIRDQYGEEEYHSFFQKKARRRIMNRKPIVPHQNATTSESYTIDVYYKAGFVLYMLGQIVGTDTVEAVLKELVTNPRHTGLNGVSTEDFIAAIQAKTDRSLESFFQAYLFTAQLPVLNKRIHRHRRETRLTLSWETPGLSLPVTVEAISRSDTTESTLWVTDQPQDVVYPGRVRLIIDPDQRLLYAPPHTWFRWLIDFYDSKIRGRY